MVTAQEEIGKSLEVQGTPVTIVDQLRTLDVNVTAMVSANVTIAGPLTPAGNVAIAIEQSIQLNVLVVNTAIAVTQSGTWNIAVVTTVTGITNTVNVSVTNVITVTGSVTVSGSVTIESGTVSITGPVTVTGAVTVTGSVSITNPTIAVTQSGTWNIATVTTVSAISSTVNVQVQNTTIGVTQSGTWNIATLTTITDTVGVNITNSITLSIQSGQSGGVDVDIASQSVGNISVNIAASAITLNVAIQSSAVTLNVAIQSSAVTLNVAIQSSAVTLNVAIQSSAVTLNVAIQSSAVTLNVAIQSSAVTLNVNITASSVALDISFQNRYSNMLTNSGFETGALTPWSDWVEGNVTVQSTTKYGGSYACQLNPPAGTARRVGQTNLTPCKPGEVLEFTAAVKADANITSSYLYFQWRTVEGTYKFGTSDSDYGGNYDWTRKTFRAVVPDGMAQFDVCFRAVSSAGAAGYAYLDSTYISRVVDPGIDTSLNLKISIAASTVTLNVAIQSSAVTLNVAIQSSAVTLNVAIQSSAVTLNVNVTNSTINVSGTVSISGTVNITGTVNISGTVTVTGTVNISGVAQMDIEAQSVGVSIQGEWQSEQGNLKTRAAAWATLASGGTGNDDYTVPAGKRLFVYGATFATRSQSTGADNPQEVHWYLSAGGVTIAWGVIGEGQQTCPLVFSAPVRCDATSVLRLSLTNIGASTGYVMGSWWGYEKTV
jgi:hypothetical protein